MAVIKGTARQTTSVERVSEGAEAYLKMLRDGTVGIADLIAQWSLEGRIFTANSGTATSPATFGAGGLDTTEFDLHIAVPSSKVIIPLELIVNMEAYGTASLCEICMISGTGSTTGAGTAITPISSNVNAGITSACTIVASPTATSGVYFTSNVKEIYRSGVQLAITIATVAQIRIPDKFYWRAMDSGILDVVGPTQQLAVYAAAQAGTGMIALKYAELPSTFAT